MPPCSSPSTAGTYPVLIRSVGRLCQCPDSACLRALRAGGASRGRVNASPIHRYVVLLYLV
jgi:hypothetical protein